MSQCMVESAEDKFFYSCTHRNENACIQGRHLKVPEGNCSAGTVDPHQLCVPCEKGTFLDFRNHCDECLPWTECGPGMIENPNRPPNAMWDRDCIPVSSLSPTTRPDTTKYPSTDQHKETSSPTPAPFTNGSDPVGFPTLPPFKPKNDGGDNTVGWKEVVIGILGFFLLAIIVILVVLMVRSRKREKRLRDALTNQTQGCDAGPTKVDAAIELETTYGLNGPPSPLPASNNPSVGAGESDPFLGGCSGGDGPNLAEDEKIQTFSSLSQAGGSCSITIPNHVEDSHQSHPDGDDVNQVPPPSNGPKLSAMERADGSSGRTKTCTEEHFLFAKKLLPQEEFQCFMSSLGVPSSPSSLEEWEEAFQSWYENNQRTVTVSEFVDTLATQDRKKAEKFKESFCVI
ncbi:uncharacterized protein LOC110986573 isoform X2 [Acanthaster planci]|uniref:Uncharacterized protein LOC110986573 isoform X2 n=1 Tax=Acanthaster planci TaxID=133434 RepID=A0A8B7ZLL8_ACAPL|nr:uncharacterized protein LOC110986573 isoform X2 [Acanthaster planci]